MPRRKTVIKKRDIGVDPLYQSELVQRLINVVMERGKKNIARKIVYDALGQMSKKFGEGPKTLDAFQKAYDQVVPLVEVRSRRVGGSVYQIPTEVSLVRGRSLALRWLIAGAASLRAQRFAPFEKEESTSLVKKIATAHIAVTFFVLFLGTLVTGSGPHAGDATADRFPFDLRTIAWLHADFVIALFGITFGLFVANGVSSHTKKRLRIFLVIALCQGLIGYVQWFKDLPEILVGLHLVGSTLVWISSWRVWLSVTKRMDSK